MLKIPKTYALFLDQLVVSGASFGLTIVCSQVYDITTFGIYAALMIGLHLLLNMIHSVLVQPMQILINKIENMKDYNGFLLFLFSLVSLGMLLLSMFFFSIDGIVKMEQFSPYVSSFGIFSYSFAVHDLFRKYNLARNRVHLALVADMLNFCGQFCALGCAFYFFESSLEVLFLFLALAYVPGIIYGLFHFKVSRNVLATSSYMKYHLKEGKWFLFTSLTQWGASNFFVLFAGIYVGLQALAALRLGQSIFGVLNVVLQAVENYLVPYVSRLFMSCPHRTITFLQKISKKGIVIMLIFSFPVLLFSKQIMFFIGGADYQQFHGVLIGLSFLYVLIFAAYPIRISIRILELNKIFFTAYAVSFVISLLSFQFLLKNFSIYGAIIGLIMNQLVMILLWQYTLSKNKFKLWKSYISF